MSEKIKHKRPTSVWVPLIKGQEPVGMVLVFRLRNPGPKEKTSTFNIHHIVIAMWGEYDKCFHVHPGGRLNGKITHWMPLPKWPKDIQEIVNGLNAQKESETKP